MITNTGDIYSKNIINENNIIVNDKIRLNGETGKIEVYKLTANNPIIYEWLNIVGDYKIDVNTNKIGEIFNDYTNNIAGDLAHAEGANTSASGMKSHAEGANTSASGTTSHAEGFITIASGDHSHAGGIGTIASQPNETVIGQYNINETGTITNNLFVIGNGNGINNDPNERSNAFVVDTSGNTTIAGNTTINGNLVLGNFTISVDPTNNTLTIQ